MAKATETKKRRAIARGESGANSKGAKAKGRIKMTEKAVPKTYTTERHPEVDQPELETPKTSGGEPAE